MNQVLVSIGSNIDKDANIARALDKLAAHDQFEFVSRSRIYETVAIGSNGRSTNQPSFYNLAAKIETGVDVPTLKAVLRTIEREMGRIRTLDKFAPRPIDLDIVYYGPEPIVVDGNCYPDPNLGKFPHLVCPLAEVAPLWLAPDPQSGNQRSASQTLQALSTQLLGTDSMAAQILHIIE